jgi:LAO/AO transport system kinase
VLMRAVYDQVIVETVGVGQSETEVAAVSDTVVFCVQPGSGDSLQYMKAGIAEIPDIVVVTKGDLGTSASKAQGDVAAALQLATAADDDWRVPVRLVSAQSGQGIDELIDLVAEHAASLGREGRLESRREAQAETWLRDALRDEFGRRGLARAEHWLEGVAASPGESPFRRLRELARDLRNDKASRRLLSQLDC